MARSMGRGRSLVLAVLFTGSMLLGEDASTWEARFQAGSAATHAGQYPEAIEILTAVAELAQAFPPDDLRRIQSTLALAVAYANQGQLDPSEKLFLEAKQTLEAMGPAGRHLLAYALSGLGEVRSNQGRWAEAEELQSTAIAACPETHPLQTLCSVSGIERLAEVYSAEGRMAKAEALLQQVLTASRQTPSLLGDLLPPALGSLARLYVIEGRYESAENLLQEALELARRHGESDPRLADSLVDLGLLYRAEHNLARAQPLLKKAVHIYERGNDPHLATAQVELGFIAIEEGKYAVAREYFSQSLTICQQLFGSDHPMVVTAQAGLAQAYLGERNYQKAEGLIGKALAAGHRFGDLNVGFARLLMIAGGIQQQKHNRSGAELYYRQALNIYRRNSGDEYPERASAERQYANFTKSFGK
jgi:tetratricopeptide (TPR) repeat protein